MNKLEELGKKYGTDKIGKHNYLPIYYDLFNKRRKKVRKVLEIGVGEGAGLFMFRDFFTNAIIYGADNDLKRVFIDPPIQVFECDQSKSKDLHDLINKTGSDLDIVIDDGSHKPKDQVFTALTLLPALNKGVVYIIEDVADLSILTPISEKYATNTVECGKRYDDRLIIIKK